MDKLNYKKGLTTENDEHVSVATYDNDSDIYIRLKQTGGYTFKYKEENR